MHKKSNETNHFTFKILVSLKAKLHFRIDSNKQFKTKRLVQITSNQDFSGSQTSDFEINLI